MSDFDKLKSQAEALGLQGKEIGQWILQQQAYEWGEHQWEREEKQAEREAHKKLAEQEDQERQAEKEKEIKLAQLNPIGKPHNLLPSDSITKPGLPAYKDEEDIATYLVRFEWFTVLLEMSEDTYAIRLGYLLTGKASELYISLPSSITRTTSYWSTFYSQAYQ